MQAKMIAYHLTSLEASKVPFCTDSPLLAENVGVTKIASNIHCQTTHFYSDPNQRVIVCGQQFPFNLCPSVVSQ